MSLSVGVVNNRPWQSSIEIQEERVTVYSSRFISTRLRVLRHPCLILGGILGVCLAANAVAWVIVANRAPSLERFARERNLAAALVFGALMLAPLFSFLKSPARVFLSGIIAWTMLAIAYAAMEASFPRLEDRLGAFHLFMMGAVIFGLMAAAAWVTHMIFLTRHHHHAVAIARRRLP
jgi:uncharacterized membrane protein YvlD (DUF360 family)